MTLRLPWMASLAACCAALGAAAAPHPLGVLGDSDSQAFTDRVWYGPAGRGGAYAGATLNWPEVLARLRPAELDPGPWGVWGSRTLLARALDAMGIDVRSPRKEDHRYNFAFGGAHCADLNGGVWRQAPRLLAEMDREPERWRDGVVVVRIGIVDLGGVAPLDHLAADPAALAPQIDACAGQVRQAIRSIHARHPQTRFVLVGILDNADFPPNAARWQSAAARANLRAGLDRYDTALRALAAADPRISFFDDRAWFAARWGSRDDQGRPAYRAVRLADGFEITLAMGDAPQHAVLADGHAGLAWNALWARSLVEHLAQSFQWRLTPITDTEVAALVARAREAGKAAVP